MRAAALERPSDLNVVPPDAEQRPIILVVDDEPSYRESLSVTLGADGFAVRMAANGAEARRIIEREPPDVVLLDINLPDVNGTDLCREITATTSAHVVMVSARAEEVDIVVALELGAADFVGKPLRTRELIARINALLRRGPRRQAKGATSGILEAGPLSIDLERRSVHVHGEVVAFSRKEFDLLVALVEAEGQVLSREDLIDMVWWGQELADTRTVDTHLKRLRKKVERDPSRPKHLVTVRGVGFRFDR